MQIRNQKGTAAFSADRNPGRNCLISVRPGFRNLTSYLFIFFLFYRLSFLAKSLIASGMSICCGQTSLQLPHPMHALGSFSFG